MQMELVVINRNDLEQIIQETVQSAFERFAENAPAPMVDAPFIDKKEAARLIGVCTSTIDGAARAGRLKRHYIGKSVRFERAQVLALAGANY